MDKLLTFQQLSEKLQLSRSTIDRWRKEGLPYSKLGRSLRFDENEVDEWIKQNKQSPATFASLQSKSIQTVHQVLS